MRSSALSIVIVLLLLGGQPAAYFLPGAFSLDTKKPAVRRPCQFSYYYAPLTLLRVLAVERSLLLLYMALMRPLLLSRRFPWDTFSFKRGKLYEKKIRCPYFFPMGQDQRSFRKTSWLFNGLPGSNGPAPEFHSLEVGLVAGVPYGVPAAFARIWSPLGGASPTRRNPFPPRVEPS